jgi:serine/threonine-protein kinase
MSTLETNSIFAEHYLLRERLNPNDLAEIWKAEDWTANGRVVTLEIFVPEARLDNFTLEQLRKEQQTLASLVHPHLLQPIMFDIQDGMPYLVMPYLAQGTLSQKLLEEGPLPEQELALLLSQVSSALDYLHTRQPALLHRHVTSDHIFIAGDGNYLLSFPEFSSKLRNLLYKAAGSQYALVTAYAAPELFGNYPVYHEASDIFSLGVVLYEVGTGQAPWQGNAGMSLRKGAELPSLPDQHSRIFNNLVRACLHPDWQKRPTAKLLGEEADYFRKYGKWKTYGSFGNVTAESIIYKKRSPLVPVLLASLLVLALLAGAYFYFYNGKLPDQIAAIMKSTSHNAGQAPEDTTATAGSNRAAPPVTKDTLQAPAEQGIVSTPAAPQQARGAQQKPISATTPNPEVTDRSTPVKRSPTYPRPTSLEGYLKEALNQEIPLEVRDQWRPRIRRYFTPDALIHVGIDESVLGVFGVGEFLDILFSTENAGTVRIDSAYRDEADKVEELYLNILTVEDSSEQHGDSLEQYKDSPEQFK